MWARDLSVMVPLGTFFLTLQVQASYSVALLIKLPVSGPAPLADSTSSTARVHATPTHCCRSRVHLVRAATRVVGLWQSPQSPIWSLCKYSGPITTLFRVLACPTWWLLCVTSCRGWWSSRPPSEYDCLHRHGPEAFLSFSSSHMALRVYPEAYVSTYMSRVDPGCLGLTKKGIHGIYKRSDVATWISSPPC